MEEKVANSTIAAKSRLNEQEDAASIVGGRNSHASRLGESLGWQ